VITTRIETAPTVQTRCSFHPYTQPCQPDLLQGDMAQAVVQCAQGLYWPPGSSGSVHALVMQGMRSPHVLCHAASPTR